MGRKQKSFRPPAKVDDAASSIGGDSAIATLHALCGLAVHPRIISPPLRVLLYVWAELDLTEFRPIKQEWLAKSLGYSQPAVSGILQSLVNECFLEAGPRDGPAKSYRIHPQVRELLAERNGKAA